MNLEHLGWNPALAEAFQEYADAGLLAGRVAIEHRGASSCAAAARCGRSCRAGCATRGPRGERPAVGDWVAYERPQDTSRARIQALLPRRSALVRRAAGEQEVEQVVAANVDVLFVVTSMDADLNPARLERYLTLAWESGADPVVVLTKADLCENREERCGWSSRSPLGIPIEITSAFTGEGTGECARIWPAAARGPAWALSGVGKSTLINALVGDDRMATGEVRATAAAGTRPATGS